MTEERRQQEDPDPAPSKHSDAERVGSGADGSEGEAGTMASEIENDPAHNPPESVLRDVKGG
jgi:hypothetical protein